MCRDWVGDIGERGFALGFDEGGSGADRESQDPTIR